MDKAHGISDFLLGDQNSFVNHFLAEWQGHGSRLKITGCTVRQGRVDRARDSLADFHAEVHSRRLDREDTDHLHVRLGCLEVSPHATDETSTADRSVDNLNSFHLLVNLFAHCSLTSDNYRVVVGRNVGLASLCGYLASVYLSLVPVPRNLLESSSVVANLLDLHDVGVLRDVAG